MGAQRPGSCADLQQFAVENLTNHQALRGKVLANVDLRGSRGQHTLVGGGDIHLTKADIYELPLVVSLLSIVRAKAPGPTAFTESDIYPLFELCGRAIAMSAQTDQTIGGLTMWIPAALVEVIGLMVALGTLMRLSAKGRLRKADRDARARAKSGAALSS